MRINHLNHFTTLLIGSVVLMGCSSGRTHGLVAFQPPNLKTPKVHASGDIAKRSEQTANGTTEVQHADTVKETPAADAYTVARAESQKPVKQVSHASRKSLITLGSNDNLFELVRQARGPVLIDFYADWCGPCRTQGSILHDMESFANQSQSSIIKINVDQHRNLANQFQVTSLPTLMLVKDGRIMERQTGVANHQRIASMLSR